MNILMHLAFMASVAGHGTGVSAHLDERPAIQDCPSCPRMIVIEGGMAAIGSPKNEKNRHPREAFQHQVAVVTFAIGETEVTRGQYAEFVLATGRRTDVGCLTPGDARDLQSDLDAKASWENAGFVQSDDHPVVCVSWADAQAYAKWLSGKTGQTYRLPRGVEWEHAARAGSNAAYFWGDEAADGCASMNAGDLTMGVGLPELAAEYRKAFDAGYTTSVLVQCNDGHVFTSPVRSFAPNGFGLFDALGNVWEWVEDCGDEAPADRNMGDMAATGPICRRNLVRGGSWNDWPVDLRLADGHRLDSASRRNDTGFRLVRELAFANCSRAGGKQC